uniref:SH3 and multiple ankyrin repeat domains protein 1 n=1 Tax=Cryptocotyle lingua TaxID=66766 RepID=A0A7U0TJ26_9TREM|nr:SH3 and multiple ankyrin repeat domains protein 1 [Cryptocotyle lingua]
MKNLTQPMLDSDSGLSLSMNGSQSDAPCQGLIFIRITCPELGVEGIHSFSPTILIYDVKSTVLKSITQPIKDKWNFGLFLPPSKGKAGKFLQEDRMLSEYPFENSVGHLELKYKQRVYRVLKTNVNKLKKLHIKSNLRQFLDNVKNGECDKVTKWLNKGLDPNFQWKDSGETPLTLAIKLSKPRDMIMTLVSGGAHLDYRAMDTMTPLHKAAVAGNYEAIKVLLDLGQSPNTRDQYDLTPLYYAVLNDTRAVCVERLLYDHATLGTTDEAGLQEIHQACRFGRVLHLETLITYGADINSQTSKNGNTPLHICAFTGQDACARLLLFRGADRSLLNRAGHTAYQQAILSENQAVADEIKNFQSKDVVPIRDNPKRNERRRSFSSVCLQQRSSSLGRLSDYSNEESEQNSARNSFTSSNGHLLTQSDKARTTTGSYSANRMTTSISGFCLDSVALDRLDNVEHYAAPQAQNGQASQCNDNSLSHSVYNLRNSQQSSTDQFPNYASSTMRVVTGNRYRQPSSTETKKHSYTVQRNSDRPSLDPMWAAMGQDNGSDTASIFSSASSLRCHNSAGSYGSTASALQLVLSGQASILELDTSSLPRMIVLQKGPRGFGFVVRGRRGVPGEFQPSLEIPALQYLEKVEPGSAADRAGLKPGDYILEVNGTNVTSMSHEAVVQLIRGSGELLGMKVITVPSSGSPGSMMSLDKHGRTPSWHTGNSISRMDLNENSSLHSNTTTGTVRSQVCHRPSFPCTSDSNNPYSTMSRAGQSKPSKLDPNNSNLSSNGQTLPTRTSMPKPPAPPPPPPLATSFKPSSPVVTTLANKDRPNHGTPPTPPPIPPPTPSQIVSNAQSTVSTAGSPIKQVSPRLGSTSSSQFSFAIPAPPAKTTIAGTQAEKIPPPPPILPAPSNGPTPSPTQKLANGIGIKKLENFQSSASLRDSFNEQLPLPPPPADVDLPENPVATTPGSGPSGLMLGMLRRVNSELDSQPASNDPKPSFDDHLRRAVELRRKKIEMHSSEDDDETRSRVDTKDLASNSSPQSTLYSSTNLCSPRVHNDSSSNRNSTPVTSPLQRNLSISQTGESSFRIAAEKFHAKALARSQGSNAGTIPPPERFKDVTSAMSNVQRLATEFSQNTQPINNRFRQSPPEVDRPRQAKSPNTSTPPVLGNKPTNSLYFSNSNRSTEKATPAGSESRSSMNGMLYSNAQPAKPSSVIPPPPPPIFANHAIR